MAVSRCKVRCQVLIDVLKQTKNNHRIQKSLNRTFCQLQNNNYRVTRLLQQNQFLDLFLWTKLPKIIGSTYKEAHQIVLDLKTTKHCLKTLDQNQAVLALSWGDDSKTQWSFLYGFDQKYKALLPSKWVISDIISLNQIEFFVTCNLKLNIIFKLKPSFIFQNGTKKAS